jgi:hypothetical protein
MKKYNIIIVWLCVVAMMACVSSCKEDEEKNNGQVTLLSFGPSGVKHGEQIKFIGLNLNKVSSITLAPDIEIPSSSFTSQTAELIEVVIPDAAEAGKVVLKTADGDIETKTPLSFEVPVEITSITEEAKPGTNITITGSKVNWIEEVIFPDEISVTDFVSKTLNELVVTVPINAQSGFIIFKSGGTEPLSFASEEELKVSLPEVTALSPASVRHTANLTLTGKNLDLVTAIVFPENKTVTEFVSKSESELVVTVPAGTKKGYLTLKQVAPVDVVTTQEVVITLPQGTTVTPNPAGPGVDITITGTDLDLVKEIKFPGVTTPVTTFVSQSPTQIVVKAPAQANTSGALFFVTVHNFETNSGVQYKLPPTGGNDTPLVAIYAEAMNANWQKWDGWGTSAQDLANTELPKNGTKAIKIAFSDAWGGFQLHPTSPDPYVTTDYASLRLSVAGGAGTANGTQLLVYIKTKAGAGENSKVTINLGAPNTYKTFDIPLSQFGSPANINELVIQNAGTANATIYVDDIGLFASNDPLHSIFAESLNASWQKWDGWGTSTQDLASTEMPQNGTKAIKLSFNDAWGGFQLHPTSPDPFAMTSYSSLKLSVAGGAGTTTGTSIMVYIKTKAGTGENSKVTLNLGAPNTYKTFDIPLSQFGNPANINELVIQNAGTNNVTIFIDDIGLF